MAILERLSNSFRALKIAGKPLRDHSLSTFFGFGDTLSGVEVTEWNALNFSAVWAAVNFLSTNHGSLPLHLYRGKGDDEKDKAKDHPVYELVHDRPNPDMSSMVVREVMQGHLLTWGNAYAEIERAGSGRAKAIWPLPPNRVTPARNKSGDIVYKFSGGTTESEIPADYILHIPGLGFDGYRGYSVIQIARESIGLGIATERYGSTFFGQGAVPGGLLEHPGRLSEPARNNLRRTWNEVHQGPRNAHRVAILEEGMKWNKIGLPPEDSQFLETRLFQIQEVARWFNMPPHLLRDLSRGTFSNIEQQGLELVIYTMRPWAVRWEQVLWWKLLSPAERKTLFFEHNMDGLRRGDLGSRYTAYATGRQWGWLSADDIRRLENMNPLPDGAGTVYLTPGNMNPAGQLAGDPPPAPAPPAKRHDAAVLSSLRGIAIETIARTSRKEAMSIRRAAKTPEKFLGRIDELLAGLEEDLVRDLHGLCTSIRILQGDADAPDPEARARAGAAAYVSASRAELLELAGQATAKALPGLVDQLCDRWQLERPAALAATLFDLGELQ